MNAPQRRALLATAVGVFGVLAVASFMSATGPLLLVFGGIALAALVTLAADVVRARGSRDIR